MREVIEAAQDEESAKENAPEQEDVVHMSLQSA
jgi:hypothetical protein